jgi:hypothetical protein
MLIPPYSFIISGKRQQLERDWWRFYQYKVKDEENKSLLLLHNKSKTVRRKKQK